MEAPYLFLRNDGDFVAGTSLFRPQWLNLYLHTIGFHLSQTTLSNPLFAIETDRYTAWNEEFKRLGVKFMICGHMHRAYMLTPYDEKCTAKNNSYPVAVASACYEDDLWGGAFVIGKESLTVAFTDKNCVEREKYSVDYKTGNVERLF